MRPTLIISLALLVIFWIYLARRGVTARYSRISTKGWLLYLFLVVPLMIAGSLGVFSYADSRGNPDKIIFKWIHIILLAVLVFGFAVKRFWQHRKSWTYLILSLRMCKLLGPNSRSPANRWRQSRPLFRVPCCKTFTRIQRTTSVFTTEQT
jgi:hypothetical protein